MNGRWLRVFGMPAISAPALGAFRTILGAALFLTVLSHRIAAVPLDQQRVYSPLVAAPAVRALAASEMATAAVHAGALVAAASFTLGILPRASYVLLVAAIALRTLFILLQAGAHDWGTPLLTLLGLLVVPWHEAPALVPVLRGRNRHAAAPAGAGVDAAWRYGFAVWLPGLTIGLAFAAAALEKIRQSGVAWVASGAVRYHFVEDARDAPFDLGLWVATKPDLAVALSLGGLLVEAGFIAVIFVGHWRGRLAFGAAAAALMAGFWVFQGVHWWAWLMLLAAFLPWNRSRYTEPRGVVRLTRMHALVVALLVAGQIWASYRRVEIEPLFSYYPMYSGTYDSPEDYERAHAELLFHADGTDVTARVREANGSGAIERALHTEPAERGSDAAIRQALDDFRGRYQSLYGSVPAVLEVYERRRPFDWEAGKFKPEVVRPVGRVELAD